MVGSAGPAIRLGEVGMVISTRYQEEIRLLPRFMNALVIVPLVLLAWSWKSGFLSFEGLLLDGAGVLLSLLPPLFGSMRVIVDDVSLQVVYGDLGWIRRTFPRETLEAVETVTIRPLRQFGGWGIRCGKYQGVWTGCLNLKGDRGVLLHLLRPVRFCFRPVDRVFVETRDPDRLRASLGFLPTPTNAEP